MTMPKQKINIHLAPLGEESDCGSRFEWSRNGSGLLLKARHWVKEHFIQSNDDVHDFLMKTGQVNYLWDIDPENTQGRVFKDRLDHMDAIAEPCFDLGREQQASPMASYFTACFDIADGEGNNTPEEHNDRFRQELSIVRTKLGTINGMTMKIASHSCVLLPSPGRGVDLFRYVVIFKTTI